MMRLGMGLWVLAVLAAQPSVAEVLRDPAVPLVPSEGFDRATLLGDWHEVARTPSMLQRDCHGATATIELRDDSRLTMRIACPVGTAEGPVLPIDGIMVETAPGAYLVRFVRLSQLGNLPLVVVWAAEDGSVLSLGAPRGEIGWIWARSPAPEGATVEAAWRALEEAGYEASAIAAYP